jgi:hypothetical protein
MGAVAGADEAGETPRTPEQAQLKPDQASDPAAEQTQQAPGFGERGRMRRRARFLRKARELAYRDLGGLVFDLHRFSQRNDQLVLAKLAALRQIDTELRGLEEALHERKPVTVLREVGIAACPRCTAIHGSDDRFCPSCGLAFDANADRPISTGPLAPQTQIPAPVSQAPGSPAQISPAPGATPAPTAGDSQRTGRGSPVPAPLGLPSGDRPTGTPVVPASTPTPPHAPTPAAAPSTRAPAGAGASSKPTAPTGPAPAEPSPPAKPGAPPTAAKPAPSSTAAKRHEPSRDEEDEPTQVLRPPTSGA